MQRTAANKEHADQRKTKIQDILKFVNPETWNPPAAAWVGMRLAAGDRVISERIRLLPEGVPRTVPAGNRQDTRNDPLAHCC